MVTGIKILLGPDVCQVTQPFLFGRDVSLGTE